jgi:hypothetical protein
MIPIAGEEAVKALSFESAVHYSTTRIKALGPPVIRDPFVVFGSCALWNDC